MNFLLHKLIAARNGILFVSSFWPRRLKWMFLLCSFFFILQALWESVVVAAIAVLLNSVLGQADFPVMVVRPDNWFGQMFGFYQALSTQEKIVAGFVLAAAALCLKSLFNVGVVIYNSKLSMLAAYEIRLKMFRGLLRNRLSFFDNHQKGALIQMVMHETSACHDIVRSIQHLLAQSFVLAAYLIMMFFFSGFLTVLVFALCFFSFKALRLISSRIKRTYADEVEKRRGLMFIVDESFGGVKQVKLLGLLGYMCREFERMSLQADLAKRKGLVLCSVQVAATNFIGLMVFVVLVIVNWKFGVLSIGTFLTYLFVIKNLTNVFSSLNAEVGIFLSSQPAMEKVVRAFEGMAKDTEASGGARPPMLLSDRIVFRDVTLDYGKGPVVRHLSLEVKKGQKVAFVGESGSGKTSIINALVRLYEPANGDILIDGVSLKDFDLDFLRSRIGVVNQDSAIFNRTIAENILMANPNARPEDIETAARQAYAHDFITAFPAGYRTALGDRGMKISGGQRQRINIAQVFLKGPEIFIMDEATSALDTKSEQIIQQVLDELGSDKTVFVVAHRLSTIRRMDVICVLDKGEIVEQGSWDELMKKDGAFAAMVRMQTLEV